MRPFTYGWWYDVYMEKLANVPDKLERRPGGYLRWNERYTALRFYTLRRLLAAGKREGRL